MDISIAAAVNESDAPLRKEMKIVQNYDDDETLIPDQLILQKILPFLPIKSAIRFQAVSKPWRNFIKHPFFSRLHLSVSRSRNPTTFLIISTFPFLYFNPNSPNSKTTKTIIKVVSIIIHRSSKTIEPGRVQYAPLETVKGDAFWNRRNYFRQVVGVCSGVFCIGYAYFALLWNPAIRDVKTVEFKLPHFEDRWRCVGFGAVNDGHGNVVNFKLLAMVHDIRTATQCFSVYSLNTDKWRLVDSPSFTIDLIVERAGNVFLNGVLYWLAWGSVAKDSAFILTFDIMSETLGRIELPRLCNNDLIVKRRCGNYFLNVVDGMYMLLAVITEDSEGTCVDVWFLIDEGNTKRWMEGEQWMGPVWNRRERMLGYWADGNAVIANARNGSSLYFHTEDKCSSHKIKLTRDMACFEYVETSVSPKRISEQDDFQGID